MNFHNINLSSFFKSAMVVLFMCSLSLYAQTEVNVSTLKDFQTAITGSDQNITLEAGEYELTSLSSGSRVIDVSGSNNIIDLTGVRIKALVGSIRETYFTVSGDKNTIRNGAIEDYYKSGLTEVIDYSAYNQDDDLAYGLKGAAVMTIYGNNNLVVGLELIVRGANPYGYGSIYGIGSDHTFSLNKRCGLLITGSKGGGVGDTLDGVTMYQKAFGHGIYIQSEADETVVRNSHVEGRMRLSADLYDETNSYDLPYRSNYELAASGTSYEMPFESAVAIPMDVMYPLSEDGIRAYGGTGSVVVENCTVKQMRGGIRTYLSSNAKVTNCTSTDCGLSNFNVNSKGVISKSSGNFAYAPILDVPLNKSGQTIELTILPSPNATGPHNIADIDGGSHKITFHRTSGPLDTTSRAMVVSGNSSTITNETEYTIVLNSGTSGNKGTSCGPVIDNGNNSIDEKACDFDLGEITDVLENKQLNFQNPVSIEVYSLNGKLLYNGDAGIDAISTAKSMLHADGVFIVKTIDGYNNIKSQLIVNKEN